MNLPNEVKQAAAISKAAFIAEQEKNGLSKVDPVPGNHYVRICKDLSGNVVFKHVVIGKAFGRITAKSESFRTLEAAIEATRARRDITGKGKEVSSSMTFFKAA